MNTFTYEYPVRIHFGDKVTKSALVSELAKYGQNVMLAYGGGAIKKVGIYDEIMAVLKETGKIVTEFSGIMSNPTYKKVQDGAALAKEKKIDFILAVGGGSVIDCCKIISAQAKLDEDIWELEYTKHGQPTNFIPMGAVVTAFGTGAEQNCGAVITNEDKMMKSPLWGTFYDFVVLDVDCTMTMPMKQVISGAFDSLSHCMEIYMGLPRSELIWAAAMAENGILKLGKVTDFQCHMIEHQLGAYTDCNHGQGLAVIHPVLYRHMMPQANKQFARLAVKVWGISPDGKTEQELAEHFVTALSDFIKEIGLPTTLSEMGIIDTDLEAVAKSTILTGGCCKKLTADEIEEILKECI